MPRVRQERSVSSVTRTRQRVLARDEQLGYIRRKGEEAPLVYADVLAVDPDARALVHRAEVQQHPPEV